MALEYTFLEQTVHCSYDIYLYRLSLIVITFRMTSASQNRNFYGSRKQSKVLLELVEAVDFLFPFVPAAAPALDAHRPVDTDPAAVYSPIRKIKTILTV